MDSINMCLRLNIYSSPAHRPEQLLWTPASGDGGRAAGQHRDGGSLLLPEGLPHVRHHRGHLRSGVLFSFLPTVTILSVF